MSFGSALIHPAGSRLSALAAGDPVISKSCSDNFYSIFFVNGIVAYSIVLACTSFQLPHSLMFALLCVVCSLGCLLFIMLPRDVIVPKPSSSIKAKMLLTSRHMQRRSVCSLLPLWAYHHFVLAYSSGALPQMAPDERSRSALLFSLGTGICFGSFFSFFIAATVRRLYVLSTLLLLGSTGILISGLDRCTGGVCPQLCAAAVSMGLSWGCLPGCSVVSTSCSAHAFTVSEQALPLKR
jgi:hypothetical protein